MDYRKYMFDLLELCEQLQKMHDEKTWYYRFYDTCISMLENDVELTEKQLYWVHKDAIAHNYPMPTGDELIISLPIHIVLIDPIHNDNHDFGLFIKFLNCGHEFAHKYEQDFESGDHVKIWHDKK